MTMEFIARRRNFLVNKDLQFSLLCITLGYVIFFFLVMIASLFVPLMVSMNVEGGNITKKTVESAQNLLFLHNNFWLPSLLCLISISIHSIRTSHRIAGPMYRLNRAVDSIRQGIIPASLRSLRKGDYLIKEFGNVGEMVASLHAKLSEIQTAHADLEDAISQCNALSGKGASDELMRSIQEIRSKSGRLGETINCFSVQDDETSCGPSQNNAHSCTGTCGCKQDGKTTEGEC